MGEAKIIKGDPTRCKRCNLDKTVCDTINAGLKYICVCCEISSHNWPCGHK